jgi:hypothetical protein
MSTKKKVSTKALADADFSAPETSAKPRAARPKQNPNEAIRSKLSIIIDMLDNPAAEMDEATLRHNVKISVSHLKDLLTKL